MWRATESLMSASRAPLVCGPSYQKNDVRVDIERARTHDLYLQRTICWSVAHTNEHARGNISLSPILSFPNWGNSESGQPHAFLTGE